MRIIFESAPNAIVASLGRLRIKPLSRDSGHRASSAAVLGPQPDNGPHVAAVHLGDGDDAWLPTRPESEPRVWMADSYPSKSEDQSLCFLKDQKQVRTPRLDFGGRSGPYGKYTGSCLDPCIQVPSLVHLVLIGQGERHYKSTEALRMKFLCSGSRCCC